MLKIQRVSTYDPSEQNKPSTLFGLLGIKFTRMNQYIALKNFCTRELNCFHTRQYYLSDTGHNLNVHKPFRRRPEHLLNVLGKHFLNFLCPAGNQKNIFIKIFRDFKCNYFSQKFVLGDHSLSTFAQKIIFYPLICSRTYLMNDSCLNLL